ncbi:MAG: invasion associated locus B family protein [Proteobacteria bacterium]|nr:invasion associated locus B family protein [Pseudomonadota bacterium]
MKARHIALVAAAALAVAASPAMAQRKKEAAGAASGTFLIATYGDWGAYTSGKDKSKVCYALSQPKERLPKGLNRDPAYIFVSNRPGDGTRNEFSVIVGFNMKPGGPASAAVGNATFQMLTKDKSAWLRNAAEEAQLLDAMKKGKDLVIKSISGRGNETTDRYSLSGLSQALERTQKECP